MNFVWNLDESSTPWLTRVFSRALLVKIPRILSPKTARKRKGFRYFRVVSRSVDRATHLRTFVKNPYRWSFFSLLSLLSLACSFSLVQFFQSIKITTPKYLVASCVWLTPFLKCDNFERTTRVSEEISMDLFGLKMPWALFPNLSDPEQRFYSREERKKSDNNSLTKGLYPETRDAIHQSSFCVYSMK